jgi:hypothetical protein
MTKNINFLILFLILTGGCSNVRFIEQSKKNKRIVNFDYAPYIGKTIDELFNDLDEDFESVTFYDYRGYIFGGAYFSYCEKPNLFIKIDINRDEFTESFPYSKVEQEKWTVEEVKRQKIQRVKVSYRKKYIKSYE